jgi:HAD superfamily hydrolase (TIGR01490 family)
MTMEPPLALFDLDHTLLDGDGDDLWCRFLVRHGLADVSLLALNDRMGEDYRAGRVGVHEFSGFYARLLAGRSPAFWATWQDRFLAEEVRPRLPLAARARVAGHREAGHLLVLTTASNRVIADRTAKELGFEHLLATELATNDGLFDGGLRGEPNMRDGKLRRLQRWLTARGLDERDLATAWFYSDSINDLPLLSAVGRPVVVNPDPMLAQHAAAQGWPIENLLKQAA